MTSPHTACRHYRDTTTASRHLIINDDTRSRVVHSLDAFILCDESENQNYTRIHGFTMKLDSPRFSQNFLFQQIDVEDAYDGPTPTFRMYGTTEHGHSVLAVVTGFLPYFYVPVPRGFADDELESFKTVQRIEIIKRKSLWGYLGDDVSLTRVFERGECSYQDLFPGPIATFESNIQFPLRFMIDAKVLGMNWIEVPAGKYKLKSDAEKKSHCQIEFEVKYDQFISHPAEGEWSKIAPLRILSFDIECAGRKGIFPEAREDPVIQIANMVTRQGRSIHYRSQPCSDALIGEQKPFIRNVFTLNSCSNIVGSQVISFDDERKLLESWRDFVQEADPDVIIGYNISNFDIPYLMDRAKALDVKNFPFLGRLKRIAAQVKETHFSSKAYGQRDSKDTQLDGRLQMDILQYMQREYKLRSYSLNSVCAQFLGEQKEDVHYSVITSLQNGTPESRRRLAVYCLKDAYLPQRLLDKLMCFVNSIEMARVTGVPFNYLLSRGQSIKVLSQLYRKANEEGYVIPCYKGEGSEEQYEGATVIEPKKGYYDTPIATLDFSSLYPSIMMATVERLNLVKDARRKGLLPTILEDLISARKHPFKRAVLDGRQLALKISANSVYGFTGATIGKLPCLAISSSVTAYGLEAEYCISNGHSHNAEVIYGDTDSVMVKFGPGDLKEVMALGTEGRYYALSSTHLSQQAPIKLEFEKVYYPYLLISKKRYAGLYWTKPEKYDKMDAKGIETVRRDNCRLVSTVIETCLHKMLIDRDVKGAEEYTKRTIADLLQNKVDMSQLVITKQAHVELAERMRQRDAGSAPATGDRVAYVIIKGIKGAAYEKSEDPLYVLENNIPIDTKYYLENQLSKPLMRIFEPILGDKASSLRKFASLILKVVNLKFSLVSGDHTRTIQIATPTVGGLMKYAVKTVTCLGCKTPLRPNNNGAVCNNCRPRIGELYQKQVTTSSQLEVRFARLWTQCQRCQGSLHQDVLCTSKDCPIFYMRKKAQKDVEDAHAVAERFDEELW
ncbi:DNA-directed DNA polymerase delta [Salix suchowensis]|nr:DNA-directed DNA polymerase delta [Salix suchowensis]